MNRCKTRLVAEVDVKFSSGPQRSVPLSEVARDNGLFLAAQAGIDLRAGAMRAGLAAVEWLLAALRHAGGQDWSETALANLEHLVLVIQQRLVYAIRQADGSALERAHKRRAVLARSWFSEFPGGVRPTSTTWPWTIRPALAVLWGVCWMFYPGPRVRATRIEPWLGWQGPTDGAYLQYGQQALGTVESGRNSNDATSKTNRRAGREPEATSMHHVDAPAPHFDFSAAPGHLVPGSGPGADADAEDEQKQTHHQAHPLTPNLQPQAQAQAHSLQYRTSDSSRRQYLVPGQSAAALVLHALHLDLDLDLDHGSHLSTHASPLPPPDLTASQLASPDSLPVPLITLDDYSAALQPAPAPVFSPSPSPVPPPHADYISASATPDYSFDFSTSSMDVYYPQPNLGMNLPHSIPGARPMSPPDSVPETAMEQPSRKRKFSDVTAQLHAAPRERASSEEHDPIFTPRGKYSHKRSQEPPKNALGKMICTYSSECAGITFDRKCEWSKHMDKHDRPYVCRHKGCEKLQGFTYSGGLLRHEREVHKMHGGTKKALFCPHQDCKRSMGTGFTRKENLAEHIRRVHRHASGDAADPAPAVMAHDEPSEGASPDAEADPESPFAMSSRPARRASGKRRRPSITSPFGMGGDGGAAAEMETDDLRQEIRRLRRENEEKDQRLKKLEATVEALTRGQISSAGQASVPV
ncbi:uncharacterized protein J3D65DRAFT_639100 [Phyllosticta citribraziliensis]|uniref:C2H2-type domain-containing protein n=1 Tax=Phyllosticta citribraziliensis TaxID=989973 RepID=A0ABR1L7N8_9PEZI